MKNWRFALRINVVFFLSIFVVPIHAIETVDNRAVLGVTQSKTTDVFPLGQQHYEETAIVGDTYSLAPLVEDSGSAYYMSAVGGPTQHTFDGTNESGGTNLVGTPGGFFVVLEGIVPVSAAVDRIIVEVRAVNSSVVAEPWMDVSNSGAGYINWRLDVGSTAGGTNPIHPGTEFTVIDSGFAVFNSALEQVGIFDLSDDTSTTTDLSGVALLGNSGADIAGVDVASILMYWDIQYPPADLALQLVDAEDGAYAPGSSLNVSVVIENVGGSASGSSSFDLYASTDTTITPADRLIGSFIVPSLIPGQISAGNAPSTLPGNLTNDNYYIGGIINISDANSANNVNYDPDPIFVSSDPEIRIRPLSLDFVEVAQAATSSLEVQEKTITPYEMTQSILPSLMAKAESEGNVRVIVGFDTPFRPEGFLQASERQSQRQGIENRGSQLIDTLRGFSFQENRRFRFIPYVALTVNAHALEHLSRSPMVTSIEEDTLSFPTLASSNPVIGSPLAWAEGYDGSGQTVAVLDSGVDKAHPWFTTGGSKVVSEACYSTTGNGTTSVCPGGVSSSTAPGSGVYCDLSDNGCDHGTHVAGIVSGNDGAGPNFGVARGADIIAIQVFSSTGGGITAWDSDIISGLERVYELRGTFDIASANMSLGGGQFFDQATCDAANSSTKAVIDNLRSVNIATVIASGNDGWRDSIGYPGCISSAISVGNSTDSDAIAGSSNIYPQIHLLAPGTSITSSVPGGGTAAFNGTSMAAPHVAGAWAVLKQLDPGASVDTILSTLQNTGTPVDDLRVGGIETDMPRINLDLAIGEPRTTFGVFNDGPGVLTISSITTDTPAPWISWTPQAPFNIQPGQLKVVRVDIDFASAPSGALQTRLLINSNDPNESPYPGGVFVNVTALDKPAPEFDSTPAAGATLAFGEQVEHTESTALLVQVDNLGDADLTLGCSITGTDSGSFNLKACPTPIAGAGSGNITVSCEPVSVGAKSATLEVATNDADEPNVSYNLTCTGTATPAPEFDSTPAAGATLAFGDQVELTESVDLMVQVDNLGDADLTLGCSITGTDSGSFNLKACPTPIAGAGSGNISVSCESESVGAKSATLDVTTNDADEANVSYILTCTGIEPLPDDILFSNGFED